jgi:23S rRNA (adenine-N6)-dimethyltransferase
MYEKRKIYSQNLLRSKKLVNKLLDKSLELEPTVLEIGPGKGMITDFLIKNTSENGSYTGVDIDPEMVNILKRKFQKQDNVLFLNRDFLKHRLPQRDFTIVSNLPFGITSDALRKILNPNNRMQNALLIMQKEAANMFMGNQEENFKSLLYCPFWEFEIVYYFKNKDFTPIPNVDIVMVSIKRRENVLIDTHEFKKYKRFLSAIVKDRTGEGVWKKILTKKQMKYLEENYGLIMGRGISRQPRDVIIKIFETYDEKYPYNQRLNLKKWQ